MGMCWVPGCTHYSNRETCTFFTFPKPGTKEYVQWVKLIRRDSTPGSGVRVCNCHFEGGLWSNLPTKFPWNATTLFQQRHLSPEKKKTTIHVPETEYPELNLITNLYYCILVCPRPRYLSNYITSLKVYY